MALKFHPKKTPISIFFVFGLKKVENAVTPHVKTLVSPLLPSRPDVTPRGLIEQNLI